MQKKTFYELYSERKSRPTPAQEFIFEVANMTRRSTHTVKMWLCGLQVPDQLAQSIIADHYGVDAVGLFPNDLKR